MLGIIKNRPLFVKKYIHRWLCNHSFSGSYVRFFAKVLWHLVSLTCNLFSRRLRRRQKPITFVLAFSGCDTYLHYCLLISIFFVFFSVKVVFKKRN